jgi:hypothetical protein
MTDILPKPDTPETRPAFPGDFPVGFAIHPLDRLEQTWEFLPAEHRARVLQLARAIGDIRNELTALERTIPSAAVQAANERRRQRRKRQRDEAALLDPAEAQAEWEAVKNGLEANRAANGERPLFP